MNTAEYLARVGYEWLIEHAGIEREPLDDGWADEDYAAADEDRRAKEGYRVADALIHSGTITQRGNGLHGVRWGERLIDWPDRVPGLKMWAGQQTMEKCLIALIGDLTEAPQDGTVRDWFAWQCGGEVRAERMKKLTAKKAAKKKPKEEADAERTAQASVGATGLDSLTVVRALDAGFSLNNLGIPVPSRPFTELLAVLGLQSLPIVSYAPRVCGFVHGGRVWQFEVQDRDGWGKVWGPLKPYTDPTDWADAELMRRAMTTNQR